MSGPDHEPQHDVCNYHLLTNLVRKHKSGRVSRGRHHKKTWWLQFPSTPTTSEPLEHYHLHPFFLSLGSSQPSSRHCGTVFVPYCLLFNSLIYALQLFFLMHKIHGATSYFECIYFHNSRATIPTQRLYALKLESPWLNSILANATSIWEVLR